MSKTRKVSFLKKVYKKKRKTQKRKLNKRSRRRKKRKTRRKQKGGYCCNYEGQMPFNVRPGTCDSVTRRRTYPWNTRDNRKPWSNNVYIRTLIDVPRADVVKWPAQNNPGTYDVAKIRYQRHIYKHMQDLGFSRCYNDTDPNANAYAVAIGTNGLSLQEFLINAFGAQRQPAQPLNAAPFGPMYVWRGGVGGGWGPNGQADEVFNNFYLSRNIGWNDAQLFVGYIPTENWIQIPDTWGGRIAVQHRTHYFRVYYKILFKVRKNQVGGGNWKFRNLISVITINLAIQNWNSNRQQNRVSNVNHQPPIFVPSGPGDPIPTEPKTVYPNQGNDVDEHVATLGGLGVKNNAQWKNYFKTDNGWVSNYQHNTKGDEAWWNSREAKDSITKIWGAANFRDKRRNLHEAHYTQTPAETWSNTTQDGRLPLPPVWSMGTVRGRFD